MEAPAFSLISSLPDEILFDILKTAADSGSSHTNILLVCKKWQELGESPEFLLDKTRELRQRISNSPIINKPTSMLDVFLKKLTAIDNELQGEIAALSEKQEILCAQHEISRIY